MCRICRKYLCPPSCPSFCGDSAERGRAISNCALCDAYICEYDEYEILHDKLLCEECIKKIEEQQDLFER